MYCTVAEDKKHPCHPWKKQFSTKNLVTTHLKPFFDEGQGTNQGSFLLPMLLPGAKGMQK
jgi:hypothetical protein